MKSLPNRPDKIQKKLDETKSAIVVTQSEIINERRELNESCKSRLEQVCKQQRILALRKHLGELKQFKKELKQILKNLQ